MSRNYRPRQKHSISVREMASLLLRRLLKWRNLRLLLLFSLFAFIFDTLRHARPPPRETYKGDPRPKDEKVFIASTHWNNEAILRSHWNAAVVQLAKDLGPHNIYVSVFESGSWDDSKGALRELQTDLEALHVNNTIILDETTHEDEIRKPPAKVGWINTPRGKRELRRIPYLSRLRNLSLKPIEDLAKQGVVFDKILFLNDVVFTTKDVLTLFSTNGESYAAACSLDFQRPPAYYDTFALRDSDGAKAVTQTFPYFSSTESRKAMLKSSPVPVQSCWNGMTVFDASPFYYIQSPLRFRGISDSLAKYHLEGSECCLIHFDNPLTPIKGVWLNPSVRVAYNGPAYDVVNGLEPWPSGWNRILGIWGNFFAGLTHVGRRSFESRTVANRVREWREEDSGNVELGGPCLINEMQVLVGNGWAHV